jgi:hypothetical protein
VQACDAVVCKLNLLGTSTVASFAYRRVATYRLFVKQSAKRFGRWCPSADLQSIDFFFREAFLALGGGSGLLGKPKRDARGRYLEVLVDLASRFNGAQTVECGRTAPRCRSRQPRHQLLEHRLCLQQCRVVIAAQVE